MIKVFLRNQPINSFRKFTPLLTIGCCLISIFLFIGINLERTLDNWHVYKRWGAPSLNDIFDGSYWGLISSSFLHVEAWHILFNLYWFFLFGKKIEFESKKAFYIFFILTSALVSSLAQLGFSDSTGIGLSGIVYAFFGYLFIKNKTSKNYENSLNKKVNIIFFVWLFFCIILTETKILIVGNAAHFAGLFWGLTIAFISKFRPYLQGILGILIFSIIGTSILWNPFSISWISYKAYKLHENQKNEEAEILYHKILERDPENEFAKNNLNQLKIIKLSQKAYQLHISRKYKEAKNLYNEILKIDKNNKWAKENLKLIPFD